MKYERPSIWALLFCGTVLLSACGLNAEAVVESSNGEIKVELMTTFEDCRLYRIEAASVVYVARCGESATAKWQTVQACGKNCTRTIDHRTETHEE